MTLPTKIFTNSNHRPGRGAAAKCWYWNLFICLNSTYHYVVNMRRNILYFLMTKNNFLNYLSDQLHAQLHATHSPPHQRGHHTLKPQPTPPSCTPLSPHSLLCGWHSCTYCYTLFTFFSGSKTLSLPFCTSNTFIYLLFLIVQIDQKFRI